MRAHQSGVMSIGHPSYSNVGMQSAQGSPSALMPDVGLAPNCPPFLVGNSTIPWPCQPAELEKHEYGKSIDKSGSHLGKSY